MKTLHKTRSGTFTLKALTSRPSTPAPARGARRGGRSAGASTPGTTTAAANREF